MAEEISPQEQGKIHDTSTVKSVNNNTNDIGITENKNNEDSKVHSAEPYKRGISLDEKTSTSKLKHDAAVTYREMTPEDVTRIIRGYEKDLEYAGTPHADSKVYEKLDKVDQQAASTEKLIEDLKRSLIELQKKHNLTPQEEEDLKMKQAELLTKLSDYESLTRHIQELVGLRPLQSPRKHTTHITDDTITTEAFDVNLYNIEERLPHVIITGVDNGIPGIVVCDKPNIQSEDKKLTIKPETLLQQLQESYTMQEKLAEENMDLEKNRFQLEEALLHKDTEVERLRKKFDNVLNDMKLLKKENIELSERLESIKKQSGDCVFSDMELQKSDIASRIRQYCQDTTSMERDLNSVETEVKVMQMELQQVQDERRKLQQKRELLKCATPNTCTPATCPTFIKAGSSVATTGVDIRQFRELTQKYDQLEQDFNKKVSDISALRTECGKLQELVNTLEGEKAWAIEEAGVAKMKSKELECQLQKAQDAKQKVLELKIELDIAKKNLRETNFELEDAKIELQQTERQRDDYKRKYMEAEQMMEEQTQHLDRIRTNTSQAATDLNIEIQRIKTQFQEKLQNLAPLPELLKVCQKQLQEAVQMRMVAECGYNETSQELKEAKEKIQILTKEINALLTDSSQQHSESKEVQKKFAEFKEEISNMRKKIAVTEQERDSAKRNLEEKEHENMQLLREIEVTRDDMSLCISRCKDNAEKTKRQLQSQIQDLEAQLAKSRALARAVQLERDEVRQSMQAQVNELSENFRQAQYRIQGLQDHVNVLKSSYNNIVGDQSPLPDVDDIDQCFCDYPGL